MLEKWCPVIGLEVHAQLLTESKAFSPDSAKFSEMENAHIHPITLALPGTLPSFNKKVLEYSCLVGLAFHCRINKQSIFARKNYFYPDLPKGYQISQYKDPLCEAGYVEFDCDGTRKKVSIQRIHIEEDAGRFHHKDSYSLVNFNRAGIPLVEIVSEPEIHSAQEAGEMARSIRKILKYLNVCDGNLEEGSLRFDCNVSVKKTSDSKLGIRTELKNLNSFRFIERAIEYEIKRQIDTLESGGSLHQETRLYDSVKNKTFLLRSKEEASDYRYFADPDLLPIHLSDQWIEECQKKIPELPLEKADRFQDQYKLKKETAKLIAEENTLADYFEQMVKVASHAKLCANWLINEVLAKLHANKQDISLCPVSASHLGEMIKMIDRKKISGKIAKTVFNEMWKKGETCCQVIERLQLKKISEPDVLSSWADLVIAKFPKQKESYKNGKEKLFGFFVGEIMKESKGQADPETLHHILKEKLKS